MAQWSGTAIFSKKVWVSVVWAAFRERNFEVGESFLRARSVPSKYYFFRTYASAMRIFFVKSQISPHFLFSYFLLFPVVCHLSATYLPPISIVTSSRPHRDLIVTSPNDKRIIKQLSPKYHLYLQLCLLSSGVPENARGVLGCLTNVIRVFLASNL